MGVVRICRLQRSESIKRYKFSSWPRSFLRGHAALFVKNGIIYALPQFTSVGIDQAGECFYCSSPVKF